MSDDETILDLEDNFRPHTLDVVQRAAEQLRKDRARVGAACQICDMEDASVPNAKESIASAFRSEARNIVKQTPTTRYKIMKNRLNRIIALSKTTGPGTRAGWKPVSVAMIRRHFEDRHDTDAIRTMKKQADYIEHSIAQLQQGSLWQTNLTAPQMGVQPNVANHVLYIKLVDKLQSLNSAIDKIQVQRDKEKVTRAVSSALFR